MPGPFNIALQKSAIKSLPVFVIYTRIMLLSSPSDSKGERIDQFQDLHSTCILFAEDLRTELTRDV